LERSFFSALFQNICPKHLPALQLTCKIKALMKDGETKPAESGKDEER